MAAKRPLSDSDDDGADFVLAAPCMQLVSQSRYARPDAKTSLSTLPEAELRAAMVLGMGRLNMLKRLVYPGALTPELVGKFPMLEVFVCWGVTITAKCGVSKSTSGGKFNNAEYYKVSCGKSIKLQGHKLALCSKEGILYTALEPSGLETSHLCHSTTGCWRQEHLAPESHSTNVARNHGVGCAGWLFFLKEGRLVCFCVHVPQCMFVRVFDSMDGIIPVPKAY